MLTALHWETRQSLVSSMAVSLAASIHMMEDCSLLKSVNMDMSGRKWMSSPFLMRKELLLLKVDHNSLHCNNLVYSIGFGHGQVSQRVPPITDTDTIVTYSVMFYYTPDFATITANIADFIDLAISETNQGYINSNIPVRVAKHCIEKATINDVSSSSTMLSNFRAMKPLADLRNTADSAALLGRSTHFLDDLKVH